MSIFRTNLLELINKLFKKHRKWMENKKINPVREKYSMYTIYKRKLFE